MLSVALCLYAKRKTRQTGHSWLAMTRRLPQSRDACECAQASPRAHWHRFHRRTIVNGTFPCLMQWGQSRPCGDHGVMRPEWRALPDWFSSLHNGDGCPSTGALALSWRGEECGGSQTRAPASLVESASLAPSFAEEAHRPGLSLASINGRTDRRQLPETMSGGVAVLDYDGDGWFDVYAVQGGDSPRPGIERSGRSGLPQSRKWHF